MTSEIIQYKTKNNNIFLTVLQWLIVETLKKHPNGLIRGQNYEKGSLMKLLKKPRTTVYDNLKKLEKHGIVERITKNDGSKGRPLRYWKLKNGGMNDGK